MESTGVIRQAAWVIAWDEASDRHVYLRDADVAFSGEGLLQVGGSYEGPVDEEIDGRDLMVMPGLVNIHSHPTSEPMNKGITDEIRSPNFHHSSLYEFLPVLGPDAEGTRACLNVALAELLRSGCTTVVDYSRPIDGWLDLLGQSGIRACVAPSFRSAPWSTIDGHSLSYDWSLAAEGKEGLEEAKDLIDAARDHPSDRLSGIMSPAQIDTCSEDLLVSAHNYASERGVAFQIHASQSVAEFHEMVKRHGCTPIQWLDRIGVLTDRTIVAHAIFLDHHSWLHWPSDDDLDLLARRGTTVAHCPTVFLRRGIALQTLGRYRRHGINVGIGTDTYPHNILEELFNAGTVARVEAGRVDDVTTADLLDMATVGGARALGRDDIGRLTPGCRADLVLVDLTTPTMRPMREPLRTLIYCARERAVRDVYVGGQLVVRDGECLTIDLDAQLDVLQEAQARGMARVPELDWAGRSADELAPLALDVVAGDPA
ncbi:MAG: amidohydrolase family protein [Actinomycetia bacterium]|nr:amidohydrolase family protein [Actinomycetes bacterium]